jgi:hypothetical protein
MSRPVMSKNVMIYHYFLPPWRRLPLGRGRAGMRRVVRRIAAARCQPREESVAGEARSVAVARTVRRVRVLLEVVLVPELQQRLVL